MKVAFVTPRYGPEIIGGAETAVRLLAEHLVDDLGKEVEIFTTCATSYLTWANDLPPGKELMNGVTVRRFLSDSGREMLDEDLNREIWASPRSASFEEAMRWFKQCGPVTTELLIALENSDADVVVFFPYLYYMTIHGIARATKPTVLHPAAHDEPYLYLAPFQEVFGAADGLAFLSNAERLLVERMMPVAGTPQIMLGMGIDPAKPGGRRGHEILGLQDEPYVVSVGRVDPGKGSVMLAEFFKEFKRRNPSSLRLVFVGPNSAGIQSDDDITVAGTLSDGEKWDVMLDATVMISASAMESFSLVVLEGWEAGLPVMVNALCGPTVEHCERSGGGLAFDTFSSFEATLVRLMNDVELREELAARGSTYVAENFAWPALIRRYSAFLEEVIARGHRPIDPESPLLAEMLT